MDNINDILASLTPEDIQSLKETAESIFGNGFDTDSGKAKTEAHKESGFNAPFGFDKGMFNPEMFANIGRIMSMMNSDGGRRCRLIEALKPNLSYERQKKADEAMQILKLLELLPIISNLNGKGD